MNDLETQLRLWQPRRPSARLEARLFGAEWVAAGAASPASAADGSSLTGGCQPTAFRFGFLAPATALLLAMWVWFSPRSGATVTGSTNAGPLVAMILSNHSAAAHLPGGFQCQENLLANTFEWTNGNGSRSSVPSFSTPKANN